MILYPGTLGTKSSVLLYFPVPEKINVTSSNSHSVVAWGPSTSPMNTALHIPHARSMNKICKNTEGRTEDHSYADL